jgi:hypothetical protein
MAKSKNRVSKSSAIRDLYSRDPKVPVKDAVAILAKQGISVQPNLVYYIKSHMKHKARRAKRRGAMERAHKVGMTNPVDLIVDLRKLAERAGGMRNLMRLAEILTD